MKADLKTPERLASGEESLPLPRGWAALPRGERRGPRVVVLLCQASWKGFWEPWGAQWLQLSLSTARGGAPKPASWDRVDSGGAPVAVSILCIFDE